MLSEHLEGLDSMRDEWGADQAGAAAGAIVAGGAFGALGKGSGADRALGPGCGDAKSRDVAGGVAGLRVRLGASAGFVRAVRCAYREPVTEGARADAAGTAGGDAGASQAAAVSDDRFDPYTLFAALERHYVFYVVVGALGRVLQGSGELTDGLDVCPSLKPDSLSRLQDALAELSARGPDGKPVQLQRDLVGRSVLELQTDAGELKIVPEPAGTRGYEDLRVRARSEPIGQGLRPQIASVDDHARMLSVLAREQDRQPLRTMERMLELGPEIARGIDI